MDITYIPRGSIYLAVVRGLDATTVGARWTLEVAVTLRSPWNGAISFNEDGLQLTENAKLTYVYSGIKVTSMEKTQVYLPKEELDALRKMAAQSGRSVAELVRDVIRKVVLKPQAAGPVAIWDGEPKRASVDHDSVHDEP